jgi:hypothetical protein
MKNSTKIMLKSDEIENVRNGVIHFPSDRFSVKNKNRISNTQMRGANGQTPVSTINMSILPSVRSRSSMAKPMSITGMTL